MQKKTHWQIVTVSIKLVHTVLFRVPYTTPLLQWERCACCRCCIVCEPRGSVAGDEEEALFDYQREESELKGDEEGPTDRPAGGIGNPFRNNGENSL